MGVESNRKDLEGGTGPFPESGVRSRPWDDIETQRGPFERRRGTDRRAPDVATQEREAEGQEQEGRRRHWGRRKADVLNTGAGSLSSDGRRLARRLREPLIGLTLAGVAAPLINAGVNPGEAGPAGTDTKATGESATATAEPRADMDAAVGDYWAEAEDEIVREATIEGAVTRYGIDRDLAAEIIEAAERHEIEPDIAFGLVNTESTFRDRAVSHVGARGLTQVMPRTAKWLDPSVSASDLFNRETNLELGFKYLRMMIDKYGGNVENALTAYNRGPGTVDKILKRGGNPDNGYAGKVLGG